MRVLINGLPYFGKKIANELNEFDSDNSYVFLDTYYSKWDKIRFRLLLPFCGAVISFNGVSDRSGSLDLVLKKKKKLLMQWHGTDVQLAVERFQKGELYADYIRYAKHFFSAPWFGRELKGIVDKGIYAPFSYVDQIGNDTRYDELSVLSYVAKGRESYYGWEEIKKAAVAYPEVVFMIVGSDGEGLSYPENVRFEGWVSEDRMFYLYRHSPVFIRLCEHDGKAFSVSQAIAAGAEVIWNYPVTEEEGLTTVFNGDIIATLGELFTSIRERGMNPNSKNIKFAKDHLARAIVLNSYTALIKKAINE